MLVTRVFMTVAFGRAKTLMRYGLPDGNALRFAYLEGDRRWDEPKAFAYDHVFDPNTSQAQLYSSLGPRVIEQLSNGFNASVFAYGQTGSGKTYTMLGTQEESGVALVF